MNKMPVVFVGHGSPMNILEKNQFTENWAQLAAKIPKPTSILVVSAHWMSHGTFAASTASPKTIYDFYGFPREMYQMTYNAPGAPALAKQVQGLLGGRCALNNEYGLDHGAWCVLRTMYPAADIPVCQLSINLDLSFEEAAEIGSLLAPLREQGVLILGSGNVVHNLRMVNFEKEDGYEWAWRFDGYIAEAVKQRNFKAISTFPGMEQEARLAIPTFEHYVPLLYAMGASTPEDEVEISTPECVLGSLSMTCYLWQAKKA